MLSGSSVEHENAIIYLSKIMIILKQLIKKLDNIGLIVFKHFESTFLINSFPTFSLDNQLHCIQNYIQICFQEK